MGKTDTQHYFVFTLKSTYFGMLAAWMTLMQVTNQFYASRMTFFNAEDSSERYWHYKESSTKWNDVTWRQTDIFIPGICLKMYHRQHIITILDNFDFTQSIILEVASKDAIPSHFFVDFSIKQLPTDWSSFVHNCIRCMSITFVKGLWKKINNIFVTLLK